MGTAIQSDAWRQRILHEQRAQEKQDRRNFQKQHGTTLDNVEWLENSAYNNNTGYSTSRSQTSQSSSRPPFDYPPTTQLPPSLTERMNTAPMPLQWKSQPDKVSRVA